jgi:hypothetical protein
MRLRRILILLAVLLPLSILWLGFGRHYVRSLSYSFGDRIDSLNGVYIYFNGSTGTVDGRTMAPDGYNIGLKYQCVEFVKRYYYEHYDHKMPDPYGNAVDFFDPGVADGKMNKARGLKQFSNEGSVSLPQVGDLVVFGGGEFGHVAIVSEASDSEIELIQQNPGRFGRSRIRLDLEIEGGKVRIDKDRILGWLRMP